jgi:hypothetical protein
MSGKNLKKIKKIKKIKKMFKNFSKDELFTRWKGAK